VEAITKTCEPRADDLEGGLADNHFAAQLDQVIRDPDSYPSYGDPTEFFQLTYPTQGLAPCGLTWFVPASRACDPTAAGTPSPRASARAEPTPPRSRPCSDTHPSTQRPGTSAPDQPTTPPSSSAYSTTDQPTTSESPRCLSTHIRTRVGGNAAAQSPPTPETVPLWAKPRPGMGEP
jgi:hypothetical protein